MANNATLYISKTDKAPILSDESNSLMSNYFIPVLWLACFHESDITIHQWEDEEDCEDIFCSVEIQKAESRIKSRKEALENLFSNITPFIGMWTQFLNKAAKKGNYLKIEVSQILDMSEDGMREFRSALKFWDNFNEETLTDFFRITCITDVYSMENNMTLENRGDKTVEAYLLGYSYDDPIVTWRINKNK